MYGFLLDQVALSTRNEWKDETGWILIFYTVMEIMGKIRCSTQKDIRLLDELEHKENERDLFHRSGSSAILRSRRRKENSYNI